MKPVLRRSMLLSVLTLTACATAVPPLIRTPPPGNPLLAEVRAKPERYIGAQVRWGGTIAAVRNEPETTWIEIVARELERNGRPKDTDRSEGRFLARIDGYRDPVIYATGRQLTVVGRIVGTQLRPIDRYPYEYPVVAVEAHYLWKPLPPYPDHYYDPFYYDPYWYPYHRHRFPGHPWYW